jgi:hypothetical protein
VSFTISCVSCETTKYSPGERPANSVTRSSAVSRSGAVSIQTGVPRRSFLNTSYAGVLIEPSKRQGLELSWAACTSFKVAFLLPASPPQHIFAHLTDCKRFTGGAVQKPNTAVSGQPPPIPSLCRYFLHAGPHSLRLKGCEFCRFPWARFLALAPILPDKTLHSCKLLRIRCDQRQFAA